MSKQKRTITVGIGDQGALQVLDWVAAVAHPADTVHLVHAHDPLPYAAVDWQLPVEDDEVVYAASVRHLDYAATVLRRKRPDLVVDDEIIRRASSRALPAAARAADLVVVGSPHRPGSRSALRQLARHSDCPVLVIGEQPPLTMPRQAPVTVLLRDPPHDEAVIEAGFEEAAERRGGLVALRPWLPRPGASLSATEAEERMAAELFLAGWSAKFPAVEVSLQLRLGDACSVLRRFASNACLLVVGYGPNVDSPALDTLVSIALHVRHAPTLLVPTSSQPRDWPAVVGPDSSSRTGYSISRTG